MNELVGLVSEKANLSPEEAMLAMEAVFDYVQKKLASARDLTKIKSEVGSLLRSRSLPS